MTTAGIATDSVVWQATISRASMLRPSGSVPRTLAQPCARVNGAWLELSRSMWVARLPTSIGPKIAVRKTRPRITAATAATRSLTSSRNHFDAPRLRCGVGLADDRRGRLDGNQIELSAHVVSP